MTSDANTRLKRVAIGAVVAAVIALLAFVGGGVTQTTNAKSTAQRVLLAQAEITQEQAEQTALAANPGTAVVETELERENGVAVYEVELSNGSEVEVDSKTGVIVGTVNDDGDESGDVDNGQGEQDDGEHEDDDGD